MDHNREIIAGGKGRFIQKESHLSDMIDDGPFHDASGVSCNLQAGFVFPDADHVIYESSAELPIHTALEDKTSVDSINSLLEAYPEAIREKNGDGQLPLHIACMKHSICKNNASVEIVKVLLVAYPEAIRERDRSNRLPLHFACTNRGRSSISSTTATPTSSAVEDITKLLLEAYPEAARERGSDDFLPLCLALEVGFCTIDLIKSLLEANPDAIREQMLPCSLLPLHVACKNKSSSFDAVSLLLATYPEGARLKGNNKLPLHLACEAGASVDIINSLLVAYPEAARVEFLTDYSDEANSLLKKKFNTTDNLLPLHFAFLKTSWNASIDIFIALFTAFPGALHKKNSMRPKPLIHIILEVVKLSVEYRALFLDFQTRSIVINGQSRPTRCGQRHECVISSTVADGYISGWSCDFCRNHFTAGAERWNCFDCKFDMCFVCGGDRSENVLVDALTKFLLEYGEKHVDTFAAFLDRRTRDISLLANTPDSNGRTAFSIAGPKCRAVFKQRLYLCGRYELGRLVHSSATSRVFVGCDHFSSNDGINSAPPQRVAIKFLRHHEGFSAEIDVRHIAVAAKAFLLPLLATFDADIDKSFAAELVSRKLDSHRYMLVMPVGDRSLEDAIVAESAETSWPSDAKQACREIAEALIALHSAGFVHGDVKPRNIMRIGARFKLIDFDAAVAIGSPLAGKISTAYAPPEAYILNDAGGAGVSSGSPNMFLLKVPKQMRRRVSRKAGLVASGATDAWSFGVTLYRALQNSTLVRVKDDDAAGDFELCAIAEWSDATKAYVLASIPDVAARNLLSQLLHKEPKKRPSLSRVLHHPFFTGNRLYTRLAGDAPLYDVFLSYRVDSDASHVKTIYEALTRRGLNVFWDEPNLPGGKNWEEGFCSGLFNSATFVCLLSREAINSSTVNKRNITKLISSSECDNLILEWRLAKELSDMGMIDGIFPLLIGDKDPITSSYSDYFSSGCHPISFSQEDAVVTSIESKLTGHLEREGLGSPFTPSFGVKSLLSSICSNQGQKVGSNDVQKPYRDFRIAIELASDKIVNMVSTARRNYEKSKFVETSIQPHAVASPSLVTGTASQGLTSRKMRVYLDGVFDIFYIGHSRTLKQAKEAFPNVHLIAGVHSDAVVHRFKGPTVFTEEERVASVDSCKWVDEVLRDAPWTIDEAFMLLHDIDFIVAHDGDDGDGGKSLASIGKSDASIQEGCNPKSYAVPKRLGKFVTMSPLSDDITTTTIIERILARVPGKTDNGN